MKLSLLALALVFSQSVLADNHAAAPAAKPAAPAAMPADHKADHKMTKDEAHKACADKKGAEHEACMKEKMAH